MAAACVAGLLLVGSPLSGQEAASGGVWIEVPPVAELEVESARVDGPVRSAEGVELAGELRIRVRTNHDWQLVVAGDPGSAGSGSWWVRTAGADGAGDLVRIEPGAELPIGTGGRGESVVNLEYRWVGDAGEPVPALPLTYTLAAL